MRTSFVASALFGLLFVFPSSTARAAGPCDRAVTGMTTGPVTVGLLRNDLGTGRATCPRTEAKLGGHLQATLEAEKYGLDVTIQVASGSPIYIVGAGRVEGSLALSKRWEVFGAAEVPQIRYLISGYQAYHLGLGDTSVGSSFLVYNRGAFAASVTGRLTLPTAVGLYQNAWPVGVDSGLTGLFEPFSFFRLHGQVSGVGSYSVSLGDPAARVGLFGLVGGELLLFDWVNLTADVQNLSFYGEGPVDHLSAAFGLRSRIWGGLGVEAQTLVPLAGTDRNLLGVRVALSYRTGALTLW